MVRILNVEHLSHGFGDRAIFEDVSFRLLKGEHIGLVGANGEGKSTFMNIITGRLMPDEGKIEWAKKVRVGYLDQHTALEKGMTIGSVLSSAFDFLYDMENEMNDIYARLGDVDEDEMNKLMEEAGTIQDMLTMHDFYMIDAKVEEVARALGLLDLGLDKDVTDLSGGQITKVLTYLGDGYGWGCERTPAEREKEREFYGIYFNEYHTQKNAQSSELKELPNYLEEKTSFDRKA